MFSREIPLGEGRCDQFDLQYLLSLSSQIQNVHDSHVFLFHPKCTEERLIDIAQPNKKMNVSDSNTENTALTPLVIMDTKKPQVVKINRICLD